MKFEQRGVASQALGWAQMAWTRRQRSIVAAQRIQGHPMHNGSCTPLHPKQNHEKPVIQGLLSQHKLRYGATLPRRKTFCSKEKPSSSKAISAISQESVFNSWRFWHKPLSCTLHVSSLLAKVAAGYTPQTGNIDIALLSDIKGQTHLPVHASSRNYWLLRADKSQGGRGSPPVASCTS